MSKLTQQEAARAINEKLSQVDKLLAEAAGLADEYSLEFHWSGPRESLQYYGTGVKIPYDEVPYGYGWDESDESSEEGEYVVPQGTWMSSSDRC